MKCFFLNNEDTYYILPRGTTIAGLPTLKIYFAYVFKQSSLKCIWKVPTGILTVDIFIYDIDEYFLFQEGVPNHDFN